MINKETHTIDWILDVKSNIGKRIDPKLIEKVIWALILLEQLKINGLNFTFKGGTALLLATAEPKRFSIDIDIITEHTEKEIVTVLQKIVEEKIFISWEDDNHRKHTPDAPIGHFKTYYKSVVDGNIEPVLLDLLYTPNPYPEVREVAIRHSWLSTSKEETIITMPTFDAILGDKLTAFAPKTTGILYTKNRPVEIIKQLYDIAFLFDNIANLETVRNSYNKVVQEEIGFRKLVITAKEVLEDTRQACFTLAERDTKSAEFNHLRLGIRNFTNFTIDRFSIDEAITAVAKVAYLTKLIQSVKEIKIERFKNPLEIKDWIIEYQHYNKLNKLKKNNPEAFYIGIKILLFNDKNRFIKITFSTKEGVLANTVLEEIVPQLDNLKLPNGYYYKLSGEAESEGDAFGGGFVTVIILTIFLFIAVLILQFKTFKGIIIVLSILPLGVIGGVTLLFLTNNPI